MSSADIPKATRRVLDCDQIEHMIISNGSDIEETAPPLITPPIAHNPPMSADEGMIATDEGAIPYYSYSIRSSRFMHSYRAGLDGPQAAWACKKY